MESGSKSGRFFSFIEKLSTDYGGPKTHLNFTIGADG